MSNAELESMDEREVVIERTFDAPRATVWQAWTDPKQVAAWWGPGPMTTTVETYEFRPGGRYEYRMTGPDGTDFLLSGEFREIVEGEKIVATEEHGESYQMPSGEIPADVVNTMVFEQDGGRTRFTMTVLFVSVEEKQKQEKMGIGRGWEMNFVKLDAYLASPS